MIFHVGNEKAITSTGVTVAIDAPTKDLVDAEVVVKNVAGQVIATKPVTIKAGATEATFQFETPLTVSPTEGWTVNGVKYVVAEMAIVQVERLTDSGKFLEVLFNKPLTSLEASEINIRETDTLKRVGVEKVALASDGLSATITLLGDETTVTPSYTPFVEALTDYTFSVTKEGKVTSTVFNLDAVAPNQVVRSIDAKENKINGRKLAKDVKVDFEELQGRTVTYWYDKDGFITRINLIKEEVKYDGVTFKVNTTDGYLYAHTATEGKAYRVKLTNIAASGSPVQLGLASFLEKGKAATSIADTDLVGKKYEYAKLVFDKQGQVASVVVIPSFDNQLLVETVKDSVISGNKEELNLKDFTVIKDGKTITTSDIKAGDVVFYNSALKIAEVYNNSITQKIQAVYAGEFKINDKVYTFADAQTISNGKVVGLTQKGIEALEASEKPVTVYFDRNGEVSMVTGEEGVVVTSTTGNYLTKDATSYDFKGKPYLALTTQKTTGTAVTEEISVEGLSKITIPTAKVFEVDEVDPNAKLLGSTPAYVGGFIVKNINTGTAEVFYKAVNADGDMLDATGVVTTVAADQATVSVSTVANLGKGKVVDLTKNDKDVVKEINLKASANLSNDATLDSKVLNGLQVSSSTPVFVKNKNNTITSTTWGELDKKITKIKSGAGVQVSATQKANGTAGSDVAYVVINSANLEGPTESTTSEAVVADVRYNTDGEVAYLKLGVNGTIKEYDLSLINSKKVQLTVGQVVQVDINKTTGKVQEVVTDAAPSGTLLAGTVKVGAGTFNIGSTNYTKAESGINVYEIVGQGSNKTIETRSFSDLAQLKSDNQVSYSMLGTSIEYVDTIVITRNQDPLAAAGVPTGVKFTSSAVVTADASKSVAIQFKADAGSTVAYEIEDANGAKVKASVIATGAAAQTVNVDVSSLADGVISLTATATNVKGTSAASTANTVTLDKTAPLTAFKSSANATDVVLDVSEDLVDLDNAELKAKFALTKADGTTTTATITSATYDKSAGTITFVINAGDIDAGGKLNILSTVKDEAGNSAIAATVAKVNAGSTAWVAN